MSNANDRLKDAQRRIGIFAKSSPSSSAALAASARWQRRRAPSSRPSARELIAVAIAVSKGCEDCIVYHVDAALKHGASEAEWLEALEVALKWGVARR